MWRNFVGRGMESIVSLAGFYLGYITDQLSNLAIIQWQTTSKYPIWENWVTIQCVQLKHLDPYLYKLLISLYLYVTKNT